ncbi:MAG: pyruvate kinase [Planctomycetota bacterium]|nr:MAG: pyruvate kinase [Planctomycetota bacterium]REJ90008.1 MAG: pyruvate kinase [Planctomycetota bacterium]REK22392.1 MAG: pyruvate kinase [Planctomycetota bacterium]REK39748.1 MAG: pyruvate kinase [Planctomycetota bacterium]
MSLPHAVLPGSFTKQIATVGPACKRPETLLEMIRQGVDVFRLNMAHGTIASHEATLADIHRASDEAGRPVGVLVDLSGPKIRLGTLLDDPTPCRHGESFEFVPGDTAQRPDQLVTNYAPLVEELSVGDRVMLADGTVSMVVLDKSGGSVRCRVEDEGSIRSRQGINLPGVQLSVPSITDADEEHAIWAAQSGVDFVGLSFVRGTQELRELKNLLRGHGSSAMVIAKIEKKEALERLEDIVRAADAVMVARGDLGVEIDVAEIAVVQKQIIETCQQLGRPVIVATQMLDSMHHSQRPTRAEATDVANAILDGADACMLSGETAIGDYPLDAVKMMNRIMVATERMSHRHLPAAPQLATSHGVHPITSAVVYGAAQIADQLSSNLIVIATRSGATALVKAKQRDFIPTVGVSSSPEALRRMCLFWGTYPLAGAPLDDPPALRRFVSEWGLRNGLLTQGDTVVSITGTGIVHRAHNSVVVYEVEAR